MSISLGSSSKKPYVGSKEVKEAYVGTQKVYSAAPPIYYGFLGSENNYELADWCQLTNRTTTEKYQNVFRLTFPSSYQLSNVSNVTITSILGNTLKFTYAANIAYNVAQNMPWLLFYDASGSKISSVKLTAATESFNLYSITVPNNTAKIMLYGFNTGASRTLYVDELRFETE